MFMFLVGLREYARNFEELREELISNSAKIDMFGDDLKTQIEDSITRKFDRFDSKLESFSNLFVDNYSKKLSDKVSEKFKKEVARATDHWHKDTIIFEVQTFFIKSSKSISLNKKLGKKIKEKFIKDLRLFGQNPQKFCDQLVKKKIIDCANKVKEKYYSNTLKQISKMKEAIFKYKSQKKFYKILNYLRDHFGARAIVDFQNMGQNDQNNFMALLSDEYFDVELMTRQIFKQIRIEDLDEIMRQKLNQFQFCGHTCFICGAPCRKEPGHIHSDDPEERKHYTPFHLPTVYLSK